MKNFLFFSFFLIAISKTNYAQIADFENLTFPTGKNYWKGNAGVAASTNFQSNFVTLRNQNDTSSFGDYWSGWAYSRLKDSLSIAYDTSDCAAFSAIGVNGSNNYAVAFQSINEVNNHIIFDYSLVGIKILDGLYITNSTIAYRSIQNGDFVAKKFGGVTGNDPDYFKVRFTGWQNGNPINDTVDFYLADFRDTNNVNDFIVKDWQYVNLIALSNPDSLTYVLESSDNGAFGMNTPAYFCIDNIMTHPESVKDLTLNSFVKIYPNPVNNQCVISNSSSENMEFFITDMNGKIMEKKIMLGNSSINIMTENWSRGIYSMKISQNGNQFYQKIIK